MFGNHIIADQVSRIIFNIDLHCRREFQRRLIVNENNYTSVFTSEIRRQMSNVCPSYALARNTFQDEETRFGADGLIVLKDGNKFKLGMYEAKNPYRIGFDRPTAHGNSRFTSQIERQNNHSHQIVFWEMFYSSYPNNYDSPPMQGTGSTCVWLNDAFNFIPNVGGGTWNLPNVRQLVGLYGTNIYTILYSMMMCKKGTPILSNNRDELIIDFDQEQFSIPLPSFDQEREGTYNSETQQRVTSFLDEYKLSQFTFLDISSTDHLR